MEVTEGAVNKAMTELTDIAKLTKLRNHSTGLIERLRKGSKALINLPDMMTEFLTQFIKRQNERRKATNGDINIDQEASSSSMHQSHTIRNLLLCITQWRGYPQTNMEKIGLEVQSDTNLYRSIRSRYKKIIGKWNLYLALKRVVEIRFVQVLIYSEGFLMLSKLILSTVQYYPLSYRGGCRSFEDEGPGTRGIAR